MADEVEAQAAPRRAGGSERDLDAFVGNVQRGLQGECGTVGVCVLL